MVEQRMDPLVDEDMAMEEMNSLQDPYSSRTTPNSIISITDEETLGDTIDLTDDLELSGANLGDTSVLSRLDNPMIIERRLR